MRSLKCLRAALVASAALAVASANAVPFDYAFTYQGVLEDGGSPANGSYDFLFRLFNASAAGAQVGPNVFVNDHVVTDGQFTVILDFGNVFDGEMLWLQVYVRPGASGGAYTTLSPRQELTATPFAAIAKDLVLPWTRTVNLPGNVMTLRNDGVGRIAGWAQPNSSGLHALRVDTDSTASGSSTAAMGIYTSGNAFGIGAFADDGGALSAVNSSDTQPTITASNSGTAPALRVLSDLEIGSTASDGTFDLFQSGAPAATIAGFNYSGQGGSIAWARNDGATHTRVEPDFTGVGGYLFVDGGTGGITLQGAQGTNDSPSFSVSGFGSSFVVNSELTGDSAVAMATGAVNAAEMLNEPGVASDIEPTASVSVAAGGGLVTLSSRTITVPSSGYVLVMGTCQLQLSHTSGTQDGFNVGVSDSSAALPGNQDFAFTIGSTAATAFYSRVLTVHGLFSVAAGSSTFYLLAENFGGATGTVFDRQLSLVFIPTAYGTVEGTLASLGGPNLGDDETLPPTAPLTDADFAAERAQSIADNQARVDAELAEMRAMIAALQAQLAEQEALRPEVARQRAAEQTPAGAEEVQDQPRN